MKRQLENKQTIEDRYKMLVEQVSDWIWEVDAEGKYTYSSPKIFDILGYLPSEVIGKTPFELMEPEEAKNIAPIFQNYLLNKLPIERLENRNVHRDGRIVILETSGSPIINEEGECIGYRGIDRDITQRKSNEAKQNQLLDIIEASHDFIATLDKAGNGLYYNPAAQQMLGITSDDCPINYKMSKWADQKLLNVGIKQAIEKGYWKGETTIQNVEGEYIPVSQVIVAHKSELGEIEFLSTIAHDITDRKNLEQMVQHQAFYDSLTNLPNRRYFHEKLTQVIASANEEKKAALLFIDLDNFKGINDNYGHEAGDHCLKIVAKRLTEYVHEADFVSRYGGDEFIIILNDGKSLLNVSTIAENILDSLSEPIIFEGIKFTISGSIGISIIPDDGREYNIIIKKADHAMYDIKRGGKNNYKYSKNMIN